MKNIIFIIIALMCSSCEKFLGLEPENSMTVGNSVTDYAGAKNIISGMYGSLNFGTATSRSDYFGGSLMLNYSAQAGVLKSSGATYFNMTYTPTTSAFSTFWTAAHACVNAANSAIKGIEALDVKFFPSPEEKTQLLAQAHCFRAFVNSYLLWSFGYWWDNNSEYGLICREDVSSLANVLVDRMPVKDTYIHILEDLDYAIENKLADYESSQKLSMQMAKALKAKILLSRGVEDDYKNGLSLITDVLSSSGGFLMDASMSNVFDQAWESKEVLFAKYQDISSRGFSEFAYAQSLFYAGYKAGVTATPSLPEGDNGSSYTFYPEIASRIVTDSRYLATMGWGKDNWSASCYIPKKLGRDGKKGASLLDDKWCTYYFRYPELYIMQAEFMMRGGASLADAVKPLNTLRSKRSYPVMEQLPTPATQQELSDMIFQEYCFELYGENGSDWLASVRLQKNGKPWYRTLKPELPAAATVAKQAWPIPSSETSANNKIKPNPEYN